MLKARRITGICLMFLVLSCKLTLAQNNSMKYGKVDRADLEMTIYLEDSSAEAVVLGDIGFSSLKYDQRKGFYLHHERHTRIKILNKEGYRWADVSVYLFKGNGSQESLNSLRGTTYNLERGKVVKTKMDKDAVFDEQFDVSRSIRKFTLPNVREGSVIEYSYTVRSDFVFNFQDWQFQDFIPKRWSKYTAEIPEFFGYGIDLQGFHPMVVNESRRSSEMITITSKSGQRNGDFANPNATTSGYKNDQITYMKEVYKWEAEKVPAFKKEVMMNDWVDYISKVDFELEFTNYPDRPMKRYRGNWSDLNLQMDRHPSLGQIANGSPAIQEKVKAIASAALSAEEKIGNIARFIRSNIVWNGEKRKYATKLPRDILSEGKGASSDINLMFTAMLRRAGISADPVLISTRGHGKVNPNSPQSRQFDYVITAVDLEGGTLLMDVTERTLPLNLLPKRCLNGRGWRVSETNSGWVNLTTSGTDGMLFNGDFVLNKEGQLEGTADIRYSEYAARDIRYRASQEEEEWVKDLCESRNWEMSEWKVSGARERNKPITLSGKLITEGNLETIGDLIYLNPYFITTWETNPFKSEDRKYLIDFVSKRSVKTYFSLKVPEGYEVDELPKSASIELPDGGGKLIYYMNYKNGVISFRSQLQINQTVFSPFQYETLRVFFRQVIEKQGEQIVLKKVT